MAGVIARQPNGLLCRHSTVLDCVTDYNMTEADYIKLCMERARMDAEDVIAQFLRPFSEVIDRFVPNNMTPEEFERILEDMSRPKEQCKHTKPQMGV